MALGGGNDAFYQSIEFAFQVSGVRAVQDLEANVQRLQSEIAAYQQQLANGSITAVKAQEEIEKLANQLNRAGEAAAAAQRLLAGLPAKIDDVSNASQRAARGLSQAALEFSRGFEDFAVAGPIGALNNLPRMFGGIAQAMKLTAPQVAAVEAAASLLGTSLYVVWQNSERLGIEWDKLGVSWQTFKDAYGLGLPVKPLEDVKDLQEELKRLTEKTWKTEVDLSDIEVAREKIEELTRAKRGYEGLGAADEATKKRGQIVTQAIVEGGGVGGGKRAVTEAVLAATMPPESPEVKAAREKIAEYQAKLEAAEKAGLDEAANFYQSQIDGLKSTREGTQAVEVENRRKAVERQVGLAGYGDEAQARWLADLFRQHPEKFEAQGVDPLRLGAGLEKATGKDPATGLDNLFADERRKIQEDQRKKDLAKAEQAGAEQVRIDQKIKHDRETKDREVEAAEVEAEDIGRRNDHAAMMDRAKAVREQVTLFGPGYDPALEEATTRHAARGMTAQQSGATLQPQMERRLRAAGVDEAIIADVAAGIIARAIGKVNNNIQRRLEQGVPDVPQAAMGVMQDQGNRREREYMAHLRTLRHQEQMMGVVGEATMMLHEIEARVNRVNRMVQESRTRVKRRSPFRQNRGAILLGATLGLGGAAEAAVPQQGQPAAIRQGAFDRMERAGLQNLALQERAMGIIGPAIARLAQMEARQRRLEVSIRQLAPMARDQGLQRGPVGPYFFG